MNIFRTLVATGILISLPQISAALNSSGEELSSYFKKNHSLFERLYTLDAQGHNRYIPKDLPRLASEAPVTTHKVQIALIKGAIVKDLISKKIYSIKKRVFAWALVNENAPYTFIVMDKSGNPVYQTHTRFVIPIKDDINIGAVPIHYTPYFKIEGPTTHDKSFKIENYLSFGFEKISYPIASQYNGDEETSTVATRVELRSYFPFKFPIRPGLALSFQRGIGSGPTSNHSWMAIELGPAFRYRAYQGAAHNIDLSLFGGRSLYYQAEFENQSVGLQSSFAGFAVEDVYHTKYGGFTAGLELRIFDVKNFDGTTEMDIKKRNQRSSSISLFFGKELNLSL
ncbi:MAG: hypothetical protein KAG61_04780 [Bacteriovoracaceae bacterium]|nr:hypothetical protein [Bacteriovoracaceae bacterium]